uniref:Uncharacterized protein n=1 Tax=Palpitomonas bilix TaxID=652834 RepID=A0A7S3GGS0_9EUKA
MVKNQPSQGKSSASVPVVKTISKKGGKAGPSMEKDLIACLEKAVGIAAQLNKDGCSEADTGRIEQLFDALETEITKMLDDDQEQQQEAVADLKKKLPAALQKFIPSFSLKSHEEEDGDGDSLISHFSDVIYEMFVGHLKQGGEAFLETAEFEIGGHSFIVKSLTFGDDCFSVKMDGNLIIECVEENYGEGGIEAVNEALGIKNADVLIKCVLKAIGDAADFDSDLVRGFEHYLKCK